MALKGKHRSGDVWILPEGRHVYRLRDDRRAHDVRARSRAGRAVVPVRGTPSTSCRRGARRAAFASTADPTARSRRDRRRPKSEPDGLTEYARTLKHYLRAWDAAPCGKGTNALDAFVARHAPSALRKDLNWRPSAGALRRAINERGELHARPGRLLESRRGRVPRQRWPKATLEMLRRTEAWYYARRERAPGDAYARLFRAMRKLNGIGRRRYWRRVAGPALPVRRDGAQAHPRCREPGQPPVEVRGEGGPDALEGDRRGLVAEKILDIVLIDGTTLDGWCVLDDRHGRLIPCGRPTVTLADRAWSRCVLGVVVTYEGREPRRDHGLSAPGRDRQARDRRASSPLPGVAG